MNETNETKTKTVDLDSLPLKERIIVTTTSTLIGYFRNKEKMGEMNKETAAKYIGCIKKLKAVSEGKEG